MDQAITLLLNGSSSLYLDGIAWTATQTTTWLPLAIMLLYVVIQANDLRGILRQPLHRIVRPSVIERIQALSSALASDARPLHHVYG